MRDNSFEQKKTSLTTREVIKQHLLPVSGAALVDRTIMHPVDTVATLKQADVKKNTWNIAKDLYRTKSFPGFYPGLSWSLVSAIPIRISIYCTYTIGRDYFNKNWDLSLRSSMIYAGLLSGFFETTLLCPSDAERTRRTLKIEVQNKFKPRVFYRGYIPLLVRTSTENTIALAGSDILLENLPQSLSQYPWMSYFTGLISGIVSQVTITPVDILKTRIMSDYKYKSIWYHMNEMHKAGIYFQSAGLKVLRMGVGNGLMLGTISLFKELIKKYDTDATPTSKTTINPKA